MDVHRKLTITGTRASLDAIVARMENLAIGDWARARDREESIRRFGTGSAEPMYAFECTRKGARANASVWLAYRTGGQELWVSQIVPGEDEGNHLDVTACNAVVTSFHEDLVEPAARDTNVLVEFTSPTAAPEDWLNRKTAALLRLFASQANKNTGSAHPSDQKRWLSFLIAAHRDREELSPSRVVEWLTKDGGFPLEVANDLAIEYEQGRALLEQYDQERM